MLREIILEIINKWKVDSLTEIDVHRIAEDLIEQSESDEIKEPDDSIATEVLFQLDVMNHQLITKDDIPAILEFLQTSKEKQTESWENWKNYWESVDYDKRKNKLKDNPFYCV